MTSAKIGKTIIPDGANPQEHEIATAHFFNELGFNVEFLPRCYEKGVHTPDIKMKGILWEIKAPKSNGKHTMEHALRYACKQSKYIIFDLRRIKMPDVKSVAQITNLLTRVKGIKVLLIITKSAGVVDLKGNFL
jgi:hypothetical protein